MAPYYSVYIYNSAGTLQAISTDYLNIKISKVVNAPDISIVTFNSTSLNTAYIAYNSIISIYRQDAAKSISNAAEFTGIIRAIKTMQSEATTIEVTSIGMLGLLGTRIVAWYSGTTNRSTFTSQKAETALKNLFNYNIGSSATVANGRLLEGAISGMTTSATAGTGNNVSMSCAYSNLLTAMQKIAEEGGGDFELTYTAPSTYTFIWHLGQLGTDRSTSIKLSIAFGTLYSTVEDVNRIDDFTSVIIGGSGEGDGRLIATRPATLPTGINSIETFIDARNVKKGTLAALQSKGTQELNIQAKQRVKYSAEVIQAGQYLYGRDYFIGDLVTLVVNGTEVVQKVQEVSLEFKSNGEESIQIEFITP